MNLFAKQKQTHRHRKQIYGYQSSKGKREKLEAWDKKTHTTIYKIISKVLLSSTENYSLSVITYNGKESEKCTHTYI